MNSDIIVVDFGELRTDHLYPLIRAETVQSLQGCKEGVMGSADVRLGGLASNLTPAELIG